MNITQNILNLIYMGMLSNMLFYIGTARNVHRNPKLHIFN